MTHKYLCGAASVALVASAVPAEAQDKYLGEIFPVGFNFCPRGTTEAAGQILSIAQNTALFSLFGTMYGGNGQTTFALPDLRGRVPINQGQGPGLPNYSQGEVSGATTATLTVNNMPVHKHDGRVRASSAAPTTGSPSGANFAATPDNSYTSGATNAPMVDNNVQIANAGGSQPFSILDPYLAIRYCVVLQGIFPSRN